MKLGRSVRDVQDAVSELASDLHTLAERHAADHDVYHVARALARRCADQLALFAPLAERYGVPARGADAADSPSLLATLRERSAALLGRSELSGLLLLRDLRNVYLAAQEAEIAWAILAQAAQALRDPELLQAATLGREDAEACGRWLRTRIKESAPQVLATG